MLEVGLRHLCVGAAEYPQGSKVKGDSHLGQLGFTIEGAATAAGVSARVIVLALRTRELGARDIDGRPVILAGSLELWLDKQPEWDAR